jgi:hypothetical protein
LKKVDKSISAGYVFRKYGERTGRKERLVKSRIAIICVALASVLFIACPMPHAGVGVTKDAAGSADQSAPTTGGSISVVNDTTRNQAVYINETGQRFDVVAAEYAGGPLVSCVQMADFTLVPPSSDADPLPVKALVAGTRNDGTPGVWEIHSDDTIDLPQPAVDDSGAAKCIVGGDMTTLPAGVQMNYGWGFHVTAFSPDGKMIVGYADNPRGVTIGGVQIIAGTTIGVYWRVSSQMYSRFCIISPPRIIGSFTPAPLPPKWAMRWIGRSPLLQQLWQYISGTLQSYLVTATKVGLDTPQGMTAAAATSAGVYDVTGTDQDGLPAIAKIDASGGVAIQALVPDLTVTGVTVSPTPAVTTDAWGVKAILTNQGTAQAAPVTVEYWLSTIATLDSTAKVLDTSTIASLPVGVTTLVTSPQSYSLDKLGLAAGTYYVGVTVSTPGEIDISDNTAMTTITVKAPGNSVPVTTYNGVFIDTYDPSDPTGANGAGISDYMELWSKDGTTRLAYYDGKNDYRSVNAYYAFINCTLTSGDYWVLVEESGIGGTDSFGYGIRVLPTSSSDYTGWTFNPVVTSGPSNPPQPTVQEPALQGAWGASWPPTTTYQMLMDTSTNPLNITSTNHLNLWIPGGGVNWIHIFLP